ncbi:ABC transporter substrate-binding protein [Rhodovastum atsumiense]|uniref:ABC transporter substrate-binding protein n=1 Tax=Rhodovastum atsumiense TaxID=504468 RepID=A0A5M6IKL8_9PROT|nr:ABC transporter substrate-binding protein [Rhodovastum atsumiense]KAA5608205.1 ABC transporter substrate-binding protein [Rhodovastum atsumiense]CAH2602282.1 ABC transporter substrate-binding protein [Rhodovastum atsumiense]
MQDNTGRGIGRRAVTTALAAGLALPALRRGAAAAQVETPSFEVIGVRDPQLGAQLAVAEALSLFKEQGLDVTVRWTQSAADTLTIMGGGAANVAVGSSFTQVVLSGQKLPVRTISSLANIAGTQGFVLSPGVKLSHPRELEGKRLAFTQGNSQVLLLAKLGEIYGFDPTRIQLVNMNQSEGVVAASRGDVQGLLGWEPNLYRLVSMGGTLYATGSTVYVSGKPEPRPDGDLLLFNHSLLVATQDWIDTKPNTLAALLRALVKANEVLLKDRAKALTVLQRVLRIDPEALKVMTTANKYELGITPALIASHRFQSNWAKSINRIQEIAPPEACFSTRIAQMVSPALVTWKPAT